MRTIKNTTKNTLIALTLLLPALALNACQTGGGYGARSSRPSPPAQQSPNALSSADESAAQAAFETTRLSENLPPVKVGILLPLSGKNKQLGQNMLKAAQMALFDIGHSNLELIPRDTKSTPEGARAAAHEAINAGSQLILGPVFASSVRAAKSVTQSARINMLAFSTDWTLAGGNTYIMGFLPFDQVQRVTQFSAARGISRIGVLAPATAYGRAVSDAFNRVAPQNGVQVTSTVNFPAGTANLAPVVRNFARFDARKSNNALGTAPFDAILMPVGGQQARAIGSLLTHYELPPRTVRRLGTGLFDEAALASEANLEGTWFAAPSPSARKSFEDRFTRTYGSRPPRLSTLAFDATALAAVLARRGLQQGNRPAYDRASLENPNGFSGIDGIFRFRADNTAERGLAVLELRKGKIKVIDEAPKTFQKTVSQ